MCHGKIVNTRVLTARISTGKPCAICEAWDRLKREQELKRARRAEPDERIREIRERGRVAQEQEDGR